MELKSDGVNAGLLAARDMTGRFVHPNPDDDFGLVQFKTFDIPYPKFDDANNLSTVVFVKHPSYTICFPGDLEVQGWLEHLQNPDFVAEIVKTNILVASHHGRSNGCCDDLFKSLAWQPDLVIISDKGKEHSTQETVAWYAARTKGINFDGKRRFVLTTRTDGCIHIQPNGAGFFVTTGWTA